MRGMKLAPSMQRTVKSDGGNREWRVPCCVPSSPPVRHQIGEADRDGSLQVWRLGSFTSNTKPLVQVPLYEMARVCTCGEASNGKCDDGACIRFCCASSFTSAGSLHTRGVCIAALVAVV